MSNDLMHAATRFLEAAKEEGTLPPVDLQNALADAVSELDDERVWNDIWELRGYVEEVDERRQIVSAILWALRMLMDLSPRILKKLGGA